MPLKNVFFNKQNNTSGCISASSVIKGVYQKIMTENIYIYKWVADVLRGQYIFLNIFRKCFTNLFLKCGLED